MRLNPRANTHTHTPVQTQIHAAAPKHQSPTARSHIILSVFFFVCFFREKKNLKLRLFCRNPQEKKIRQNKAMTEAGAALQLCHLKVIWKIWPKLTRWVLLSYPCSISPNSVSLKRPPCLPPPPHLGPSQLLSDCRRQERPSSARRYSCTHLRVGGGGRGREREGGRERERRRRRRKRSCQRDVRRAASICFSAASG